MTNLKARKQEILRIAEARAEYENEVFVAYLPVNDGADFNCRPVSELRPVDIESMRWVAVVVPSSYRVEFDGMSASKILEALGTR